VCSKKNTTVKNEKRTTGKARGNKEPSSLFLPFFFCFSVHFPFFETGNEPRFLSKKQERKKKEGTAPSFFFRGRVPAQNHPSFFLFLFPFLSLFLSSLFFAERDPLSVSVD
jgi:hypothetical protein